jgi:myo-inositol-1(or 4)-monophosphatase
LITNIQNIIREAGSQMLRLQQPEVYTKSGHANYVTEGDLFVQQFLIAELAAILPDSLFFAEEKEDNVLTDQFTWVIDPIDGTLNYMRGRSCSSISVALLKDRHPVLGLIYNPYLDELFQAEAGHGAWLNGKKIKVSSVPFRQAVVSFGTSPYYADLAGKSFQAAHLFLQQTADLRRTGSAAIDLCDVACGRSDVFFELRLSPWDFAAGTLIVTEAGGCFGMPEAGEIRYDQPGCVLVANQDCFEPAKQIVLAVR